MENELSQERRHHDQSEHNHGWDEQPRLLTRMFALPHTLTPSPLAATGQKEKTFHASGKKCCLNLATA